MPSSMGGAAPLKLRRGDRDSLDDSCMTEMPPASSKSYLVKGQPASLFFKGERDEIMAALDREQLLFD